MKKEYCDIFNRCFPQFMMSYERFCSLFPDEKNVFFEYEEDSKLQGFAIVEDFAIRLICVNPDKQLSKIGTRLIRDIERALKAKGYSKIITGGVSSRLFIGAASDSWGFFEKNGYEAVGECEEMLMPLKNFSMEGYAYHGHDIAEYGWFDGDIKEIQGAVSLVEEDWVQYYNDTNKIYVGRVDGEIASFCLVDENCQNYLTDKYGKIGMPGCVGTVPKYRDKGIGIEMVANVTKYLKEKGMDVSFIFFTGVAKWYSKIGYETFLTEVFGEKTI